MARDEIFDTVIVGAGISGIGVAARMRERCPKRSLVMLERRAQLGGTWDLFRYPGIRSDVDMFTLGFGFHPFHGERDIASGADIRAYLDEVVDAQGLREHIRFNQHVVSANWDSGAGLWTLTMADGGTVRGRFVVLGAGYYDHDDPYDAKIPGLELFGGKVIHPQFWPEDYDHAGKRMIIVGSGATAVSLLPSLAETAAHVTMLQRTPTYYLVRPWIDHFARRLAQIIPEKWAFSLIRRRNAWLQGLLFRRSKSQPDKVSAMLLGEAQRRLGDNYREADYVPPYAPFDQRICIVPDGDMFDAINSGKADVTTGRIATVDETGVLLEDGRHLDADAIVTATGLTLAIGGKIALSLDGAPIDLTERFFYRNCMFSNVPNLAVIFGYLNSGWTLRVDIVSAWLCRLWSHMDARKQDVATPTLPEGHGLVDAKPVSMFSSGYIQRSLHLMPKSAATPPWRLHMIHAEDRREMAAAPIEDGWMKFVRVSGREAA